MALRPAGKGVVNSNCRYVTLYLALLNKRAQIHVPVLAAFILIGNTNTAEPEQRSNRKDLEPCMHAARANILSTSSVLKEDVKRVMTSLIIGTSRW